jgi:hypothetical protein
MPSCRKPLKYKKARERRDRSTHRSSLSWITVTPVGRRKVIHMNVQIFNKPVFADNFWLQTALLVVAAAILIALAAKYVW